MAEYIGREAALESLCTGCECVPIEDKEVCPYRFTGCQEYANIFAIPAADVVPVVRCRDCKHRDPEDKKCDCGGLEHAHMFPVADDWFCADGERKDGDA